MHQKHRLIKTEHPDIEIYLIAIVDHLNRNGERIPAEGPANKYGGRTCGGELQ